MNCLNGRIKVKFDVLHNKVFNVGGIELIRPDEWLHKDDEGKQTFQENVNYLETKPQVCTVLEPNSKYPYQVGDKLFVHYMAYETAELGDLVTQEGFIIADYVFFTFVPSGEWKMAKEVHFGEQLFTEDEVTPHGIILAGKKPKLCQVKLTHLPEGSQFEQNEIVLTIDSYNYVVNVEGRSLVMLREHEIVGRIIEDAPIIP